MQDGRLVLAIYSALWIFIVLSFSQAYGENLFRWTDDTGRLCYSNVSPPTGMKTFRVDTVIHPTSDRPNAAQASTDTITAEKIHTETTSIYSGFSAAFLEQRITDRKRSIGYIEALLRKHPSDSALRKSLFKKKQYLFEDLNRLKNVRP